jgi:adenylate cyclase
MAQAEDAGLVFAFRARTIATLTLAAAVLVLAPWPRSLVYVGFAGGFLLFGFIPFALRRHPWAKAIKLIFVPLDVMLITAAVLNIPAAEPCAST